MTANNKCILCGNRVFNNNVECLQCWAGYEAQNPVNSTTQIPRVYTDTYVRPRITIFHSPTQLVPSLTIRIRFTIKDDDYQYQGVVPLDSISDNIPQVLEHILQQMADVVFKKLVEIDYAAKAK